LSRLKLQVIDYQARLLGSVYIQAGFADFHFNLVLGLDTRLQINVGLVFFRSLLPRAREVEIRVRAVLRGVIAPDLIVSSAVGGTKIDVFVLVIRLEPKSDTDESAGTGASSSSRLARQFHFDSSRPEMKRP
jgi:hypothetical protein